MRTRVVYLSALGLVAMAALVMSAGPALAQRGGGGGGRGFSGGGGGRGFSAASAGRSFSTAGVRPAGAGAFTSGYRGVTGVNYSGYRGVTGASYSAYRGGIGYGYRPYYGAYHGYYHSNFYRPYYHHHFHYWPYYFPFAFGFYFPYYGGLGGYYPGYGIGPAAYDSYLPPVASDYSQAPATPPATDRPPPDDAAHLQLTVPENAEVLIDDNKTMQTGKVREFVSPPLKTGTQYSYRITVRYTNADGKPVDDTRDIRFTANDWFAIDFTRPPPAPTAPQPKIVPKGKEE